MQSNYGSILGVYGERPKIIVKKLLEKNAVHLLGSDVHRKNSIYPKVPEAITEIKKIVGSTKLYELTTLNPKKILANKKIEIENCEKLELSIKEKVQLNMKK